MENIQTTLKEEIKVAFNDIFNYDCLLENISIDDTPKNFDGFYTLVIFPHLKHLNCKPEEAGIKIGDFLKNNSSLISNYNVVKGFLNLDISDSYFVSLIKKLVKPNKINEKGREVMVEFASPNTNKPLHLGHLRNIFLGDSVSRIYNAYGYKTHKVQIINDRGIHICKSMVAWKLYADNKTPDSEGIKGDKFVGDYYVKFETENQRQVNDLIEKGYSSEDASKNTALMKQAINLLKLWEDQDPDTIDLWKKMNSWVYDGFDSTHESININFDKNYYESDTYLLGKKNVLDGLKKGIFYQNDDNSIWVDLVDEGLDNKILIRNDGTSVYMTQDIGTAIKRFEDFPKIEKQIYTVGNEQDYHFKVLFKILKKLDYKWADECYHLSYGMVDLPDGKMKSREGKVVDADDLVSHMIDTAKTRTLELGKVDDFEIDNLDKLCKIIALGALKYFLLKVDPKKKMLFNPEESIDFNGNTGPFIQYTYARIRSIVRRADKLEIDYKNFDTDKLVNLSVHHKKIINQLNSFSDVIELSAKTYSPSIICQYVFDLSKLFNSFYQVEKIIDGKNNVTTSFKIALSDMTSLTISRSLKLLGIDVPEKM
ncbi:MAG: arginine--tRNA ligase [Flammeovirgaceae bacterium]